MLMRVRLAWMPGLGLMASDVSQGPDTEQQQQNLSCATDFPLARDVAPGGFYGVAPTLMFPSDSMRTSGNADSEAIPNKGSCHTSTHTSDPNCEVCWSLQVFSYSLPVY